MLVTSLGAMNSTHSVVPALKHAFSTLISGEAPPFAYRNEPLPWRALTTKIIEILSIHQDPNTTLTQVCEVEKLRGEHFMSTEQMVNEQPSAVRKRFPGGGPSDFGSNLTGHANSGSLLAVLSSTGRDKIEKLLQRCAGLCFF